MCILLDLYKFISTINGLFTCTSSFLSECILQGKRGIEKQPFQLPDFIAATGIEKIRQVNAVMILNAWCLMALWEIEIHISVETFSLSHLMPIVRLFVLI